MIPQESHREIVARCEGGREFAVAVVLGAAGSAPCKAGGRAIIDSDGGIRGTVGGGLLEAEVQRRAVELLGSGRAVVFDFALQGDAVASGTPICGGTARVLIDSAPARHHGAYAAAAEAVARRERGAILITVRSGRECDVFLEYLAEQEIPPNRAFPAAEVIRRVVARDEPELLVEESPSARVEVFVEPVRPRPLLLIVGGGHIGQAVALQASLVGFETHVIDDRPEFTSPRLFPQGTVTHCGQPENEIGRCPLDGETYVVIVTRGHRHDAEALAACLRKPAAYVGMIGSRRKVAMMRQEFIATGRASAEEFDRVYAPIGLDIGAATVPEIATSIVAQLIAVRRQAKNAARRSAS